MTVTRTRKKSYEVRPGAGNKVIRRTTIADAVIYEQLGVWQREYDSLSGEIVCFRLVGQELRKVDSDLPHVHSSTAISREEMDLNLMHSSTYGMREEARLTRIRDGKLPEDRAERTQGKIRIYPHVGAAAGDILRAWPRSA